MISRLTTGKSLLIAFVGAAVGLAIWATIAFGLVGQMSETAADAKISVLDSNGQEVGYVLERDLDAPNMPPSEVAKIVNERGESPPRRIPVRAFENDQVVGHMVDNVGFVPLDE